MRTPGARSRRQRSSWRTEGWRRALRRPGARPGSPPAGVTTTPPGLQCRMGPADEWSDSTCGLADPAGPSLLGHGSATAGPWPAIEETHVFETGLDADRPDASTQADVTLVSRGITVTGAVTRS